ncbi:GABAperm: GABA permease [compost metagenome]
MPVSGSFQAHATRYVGPATGFMVGWVYWLSWATTVGLEFTAAGMLMDRWFPDVPVAYWSALFVALLFGINSLSTRAFGEAEYWFSGVKVAAILIFIVVGILAIFGGLPLANGEPAPKFSNLIGDSLFPNGISAVLAVMMTVVYAFQGCEIMGLTAILSVGNSGLYASTRILWAMSRTGMAPRSLGNVSKRGVPLNALSVTLCFALLSLLTSFIAADTLFMILTAISGLAGTVTWIVIALAQYRFRREHYKAGGSVQDLKYAAPLFPLIPIACILLCCSLFVFLALDPTQRPSLYWGFGFIALCYGAYYVLQFKRQRRPEVAPAL